MATAAPAATTTSGRRHQPAGRPTWLGKNTAASRNVGAPHTNRARPPGGKRKLGEPSRARSASERSWPAADSAPRICGVALTTHSSPTAVTSGCASAPTKRGSTGASTPGTAPTKNPPCSRARRRFARPATSSPPPPSRLSTNAASTIARRVMARSTEALAATATKPASARATSAAPASSSQRLRSPRRTSCGNGRIFAPIPTPRNIVWTETVWGPPPPASCSSRKSSGGGSSPSASKVDTRAAWTLGMELLRRRGAVTWPRAPLAWDERRGKNFTRPLGYPSGAGRHAGRVTWLTTTLFAAGSRVVDGAHGNDDGARGREDVRGELSLPAGALPRHGRPGQRRLLQLLDVHEEGLLAPDRRAR